MRGVERELVRLEGEYGTACSEECLRCMKRIYRRLRVAIMACELAAVERRKQSGRLTPKEAQHERARIRRRWLD